jgi:hypothetical protein
LVKQLVQISEHESYKGIWPFLHVHGYVYTGPMYASELRNAIAALSRLSSPGAQQPIESGEGPGPSTLAVDETSSPFESRRGGPVAPSPSKGEGDLKTVLAQLATARERVDYYAHLMPASVAQSLRDALASPGAQERAGEDVWRHKKRGSTYKVVGEAQVQAETPLTDYECVTVYRCLQSGELWVRRNSEFHDGRFELVTAADPAAPGAEE